MRIMRFSNFYSDLSFLGRINWDILQSRDFRHDPDNPDKFVQYEAEALVYQEIPVDALDWLIGYNVEVEAGLKQTIAGLSLQLRTAVRPGLYF